VAAVQRQVLDVSQAVLGAQSAASGVPLPGVAAALAAQAAVGAATAAVTAEATVAALHLRALEVGL
jgi:hypothetical protein